MSLDAVADATRIARRHLEALERGDLGALPSGPFAKGYVQAYAEFLGLDPQPVLEAWRSEARRLHLDPSFARDRTFEELSHFVERRAGATPRLGRRPGWMAVALAVAATGLVGLTGALAVRACAPRSTVATPSRLPPPATPEGPLEARAASAAEPRDPRTAPPPPAATPPPREAARPAPPPNEDLRVSDSGVGTDVRKHRLVGRADRFVEGSEVIFWTLVLGGRPGDGIRHVWFHEGQAVMRADLEVDGPHWRTYSRRLLPLHATGRWMVEAREPGGRLLARQEFLCVPADQ